jgi:hypothetical protein
LSQSRNLNRTLRMTRWACRVCKDEPSWTHQGSLLNLTSTNAMRILG